MWERRYCIIKDIKQSDIGKAVQYVLTKEKGRIKSFNDKWKSNFSGENYPARILSKVSWKSDCGQFFEMDVKRFNTKDGVYMKYYVWCGKEFDLVL